MKKYILPVILFFFSAFGQVAFGAELIVDKTEVFKAQVMDVILSGTNTIEGTNVPSADQILSIEILDGHLKGKQIEIKNDYLPLKEGQKFYLTYTIEAETDREVFSVGDVYRVPSMMIFVALFIVIVLIFGGVQGARGLISLTGSLLVIVYVLLPGVMHGISPIILSITTASIIIIIGSYVTHGFNKTTSSAVIGMITTVVLTGVLAWFAVHYVSLTGFENEESVYLNFNTEGQIDFPGLLLGGIIIGLLGVLYDAAIGQAVAVEELYRASEQMSPRRVYNRAIRMGREHIGALVNTLAIAYVGASLPLLLLFYGSSLPFLAIINKETFAAEVVRTMIGSIGLVLAVPITTLISVWMLRSFRGKEIHGKTGEHHHSHTH